MKEITIYCDICKTEIKCLNQDVHLLPNNIKIVFGSGVILNYDHVCPVCNKKILDTINDLIKLKGV